jgi:CDP-L-myo-inositol myo-inositolphosphotransferase
MNTLFVLRFDRPEEAERRIAGAAAAAHLAAAAGLTGARDIRIVIAGALPLSLEAKADVHRACPFVRFVGGEAGSGLSISGRFLVSGESLLRFLESEAHTLLWCGEAVAVKAGAAGGTFVLAFDEAVRCDDENEAARWVLKGTEKATDGIVSRRLNRPISQAISRQLLKIESIRPWQMTLVTAGIAVFMVAALLTRTYGGLIAGGLLFHLASVIDGVDGEIARATYRSSARGAAFDTTVDMATNLCFYLGFTVAMTHLYGPRLALLSGASFVLALVGLAMMVWLARRTGAPGSFDFLKRYYRTKCPTGLPRLIIDAFITLMSRDTFAFLWALAILVHAPLLMAYGFAFFAVLWVILILIAAPELLRVRPLTAPGALALGSGAP